MKLKIASDYASLSPKRLKALAANGTIVGFPDPDDRRGPKGEGVWIFDRESIDRYRFGQASQSDAIVVQKALLAIKRGKHI